jgi:hypothetical protein
VLAITLGWLGPQLLTLIVAIMLLLLPAAPDADVQNGLAIVKPLAFAALLPGGWILLQILPVPLGSVDHPAPRPRLGTPCPVISASISDTRCEVSLATSV